MQNVSAPGSDTGPVLRYFFSTKDDLLVVTFSGLFGREGVEVMRQCLAEIPSEAVQSVICNLADVSEVDRAGAAEFIRFQRELRTRTGKMKICAISTALKEALDGFGALRASEVAATLLDAIKACRH